MSFVGLSFLLFLVFQTKGKVPTSSYVRHGTVSCDRLFYGKEYWQTATVKASADHRSDTNVKKCSEFSNSDLSCETADSHDQPSTSSVNGTKTTTASKKFTCLSNVTANDKVVIINSSDVFSAVNETGSVCCAVLFFARWCRFSAKAAPAFNALVRVIPELQKFAVDMSSFSPLNSQLGIVSLPTLLFFKGGKVILRFNTTITLENVADFVMHYTDLRPNRTVKLESADYNGTVPSIAEEKTDFILYFSVAFVLFVLVRLVFVSRPQRVVARWIWHRFNG